MAGMRNCKYFSTGPVNNQTQCAVFMILSLLPVAYFNFLAAAVPPGPSESVK